MASNKLTVSELDFDNIKTNLRTFLQGQSEFQDYKQFVYCRLMNFVLLLLM